MLGFTNELEDDLTQFGLITTKMISAFRNRKPFQSKQKIAVTKKTQCRK